MKDNGGGLGPNPVLTAPVQSCPDPGGPHSSTLLAECVRASYLNDIIDFIADVHTLTKIKVSFRGHFSCFFQYQWVSSWLRIKDKKII